MKIERIDPFTQTSKVTELIGVYRQSFGFEPWHEGYKCPVCQKNYSLDYKGTICTRCIKSDRTVLLVQYWPFDCVIANFYTDMLKSDSICLTSEINSNVIGFIWGFAVDIDDELESLIEAPGLGKIVHGKFFYAAECAVLPGEQKNGLGKKMLVQLFNTQKYNRILLRTLKGSPMHYLIKKMGGEVRQSITRDRVMMTITF